jgi:hypothetical protein
VICGTVFAAVVIAVLMKLHRRRQKLAIEGNAKAELRTQSEGPLTDSNGSDNRKDEVHHDPRVVFLTYHTGHFYTRCALVYTSTDTESGTTIWNLSARETQTLTRYNAVRRLPTD